MVCDTNKLNWSDTFSLRSGSLRSAMVGVAWHKEGGTLSTKSRGLAVRMSTSADEDSPHTLLTAAPPSTSNGRCLMHPGCSPMDGVPGDGDLQASAALFVPKWSFTLDR